VKRVMEEAGDKRVSSGGVGSGGVVGRSKEEIGGEKVWGWGRVGVRIL